MSVPSCIVPPSEQMVIRPYLVSLLSQFHGMENKNPYTHIKDFEEVCHTVQEGTASIDLMRLKLFPFTLKDKAKVWLNSLRPRTHCTSRLKRQISNFVAMENEKFYACWERYMEAVNACPYHEISRSWDEPHGKYSSKAKPQNNSKGGTYALNEDADILEELEAKGAHEIKVVNNLPMQIVQCSICQSGEYLVSECPTIPVIREMFTEQANAIGFVKYSKSSLFSNTFNPGWKNHPNLSWKSGQGQFSSNMQTSQHQVSPVEQAIVNLSKVMGDFIEDQKNINTQVNQRINHVETSFNQKFDSLETNLTQKKLIICILLSPNSQACIR
ncbi:hypothetical protein AAG906_008001 [Vitis piasezkii]